MPFDELNFDDLGESLEEDLDFLGLETYNLREIPRTKWASLRVSSLSHFGDNMWNFRDDIPYNIASATIYFDREIYNGRLTDEANSELLFFVKSILFYTLPQNNIVKRAVKSYTTALRGFKDIIDIAVFLAQKRLLISSHIQKKTIQNLRKAQTEEFISEVVKKYAPHTALRILTTLDGWFKISAAQLLPPEFSLNFSPIGNRRFVDLLPETRNSTAWLPIPDEDIYPLIKTSLNFVEKYSHDIIALFKQYELTRKKLLDKNTVAALACRLQKYIKSYKFAYYEDGKPWLIFKQLTQDRFSITPILFYARLLIAACWVLIIFPLGLRRSEIEELELGCCKLVDKDADRYEIRVKIFKTSEQSRGEVVNLPCPSIVATAISLLEKITEPIRSPGERKLFLSISNVAKGKQRGHRVSADYLDLLCSYIGIEETPHSHQFRKSIASFFVYQNTQNIHLLKHLFSHKSLSMTLKYIMSIPTISRECKELMAQNNKKLLAEIFSSAACGNLGGIGGRRVQENLLKRSSFRGLTENEIHDSVDSYVDAILEEGIYILHRAPLGICMKASSISTTSACDGYNEKPTERLHPNLARCVPYFCSFAAFTPQNIRWLQNDMNFHERILSNSKNNEKQRNKSERIVRRCREILAEISNTDKPLRAKTS